MSLKHHVDLKSKAGASSYGRARQVVGIVSGVMRLVKYVGTVNFVVNQIAFIVRAAGYDGRSSIAHSRSLTNFQCSETQPVFGTGFVVSLPDPPPEFAAAGGNWTCPPVGQKDHIETIVSTKGIVCVVA